MIMSISKSMLILVEVLLNLISGLSLNTVYTFKNVNLHPLTWTLCFVLRILSTDMSSFKLITWAL